MTNSGKNNSMAFDDPDRKLNSICRTGATEAKDYDPHDYGNKKNPTSVLGTVFHIIIISAGPSLLSLPSTFVKVGYITGSIITLSLVLLYWYNMNLIIEVEYRICKLKRVPSLPYAEVIFAAFKEGPALAKWMAKGVRWFTYAIFAVMWFGFCCFTSVMLCQNLQVLCSRRFQRNLTTPMLFTITLVPILLLCWIRKLKYLAPFSIVGSSCNGMTLILVVYYIVTDPSAWNKMEQFGSVSSIPLLAGSVFFSLNATGIMISLKNELEYPKKFNSRFGVLSSAFVPLSIICTAFSLVCGMKYGSHIQHSVIQNLPEDHLLSQIGILLASLTLMFHYPLLMYVPFEILWNRILSESIRNHKHKLVWEYVLRTALVAANFLVSYAFPNIFLFLSISGTVGTSIDSLIFPALANTFIMWKAEKMSGLARVWMVARNSFIIAVAIILVITGCVDSVKQVL